MATLPKTIIILGPPGSGKDTQAFALAKEFGYFVLVTGDLFRAEIERSTPLGKRIKQIVEAGELVAADLAKEVIDADFVRHESTIKAEGLIINTYPRMPEEISHMEGLLDRYALRPVAALFLNVADDELFRRLTARAQKEHRADDTPAVIRHRIAVYKQETAPILDHFGGKGQLITIDGSAGIPMVTAQSIAALKRWQQ